MLVLKIEQSYRKESSARQIFTFVILVYYYYFIDMVTVMNKNVWLCHPRFAIHAHFCSISTNINFIEIIVIWDSSFIARLNCHLIFRSIVPETGKFKAQINIACSIIYYSDTIKSRTKHDESLELTSHRKKCPNHG